jgi:predicted  nucleic acid-binding Zn-ribbon protein/uncharacterized membrane protein YhdT
LESLILSIRLERRWALWGALACIAGWIVAAVLRLVPATLPLVAGMDILGLAAAVLPPLALALLVVAMLPGAGRSLDLAALDPRLMETRALVDSLVRDAAALDAAIAGSAARIEALAAQPALVQLAENAAALDKAVARINASGQATGAVIDNFGNALPALERTIAAVEATLRTVAADSANAFRGVETMMAAVQARNHTAGSEAEATLANLTALLARIDEASTRNTAALSKRAYALDAAVDGVLERTTAAVDGIHARVVGQLQALAGGVDGAGRQLGLLGDDGIRLFNQRLDMLRRMSDDLQARFAAHNDDSGRLRSNLETWLDALAARLADAGSQGAETARVLAEKTRAGLEPIEAQMTAIAAQIAQIAAPVAATGTALAALETQAGAVAASVETVETGLAARLGSSRAAIAAMAADADRLIDAVRALEGAADDGSAQLGEAATRLGRDQQALAGVAADISSAFETTRTTLGEIESRSERAAAAIESGLAGQLERLAAATDDTAAAMQARLAAVLDDTIAALGEVATRRAESAFETPLRAQLQAVEQAGAQAAATGQAAAAQLARSMLSLVETVNAVDARIGEVETRFAIRARDSMASRAMRIMRQLEASSIDIAQLLRLPISDVDWQRHQQGDGAAIAQAVVLQIDRDTARQMERLFRQDPAFNAEAGHFCTMFETMVQRLLGDTDGDALATTLLSSDIGKLYVGIADATGRGAARH